jgi:hypothetical protein
MKARDPSASRVLRCARHHDDGEVLITLTGEGDPALVVYSRTGY